jgi:hypothetical protein
VVARQEVFSVEMGELIRRHEHLGVRVLQTEDDDQHDWADVCCALIMQVEVRTLD